MRFVTGQKGLTLIEVLIAIAILGMIAVPFLTALSTSSRGIIIADERTTAESLVRSEMEYIKNSPYNSTGFSYAANISTTPTKPPSWDGSHALDSYYAGYSVNVTGVPINSTTGAALSPGVDLQIQNITVNVYHGAKLVLTTSTYKVNR
jgi:prepilin-type N-terminal cleavage/methylation domain-containing protein